MTGWPAVDAQVAQLRIRLASAATPEDHQAVGLLCRDLMISLAQAAYDGGILGDVGSSAVDQLYAVVDHHAGGHENEKLRRLLKTTIDFANVVQHRRGVSRREAGLVAEATVAAVTWCGGWSIPPSHRKGPVAICCATTPRHLRYVRS